MFKSLNWDAMLNMIKVELELTSDADMHLFFEKCIRGRVSYISKRFNKVNHKYLISYGPKQEEKEIIQLDANKLSISYLVLQCLNILKHTNSNV